MHNATAITTGSANQRPNTPCIRLWIDVTIRGLEDPYSLFCWRFENNFLLIITSDHSYFLLYIWFEYLSSEITRKLWFSGGIPWVSSEKSVVTSRSKQGGGMKTTFYRLNRCVDQSTCFVGRVDQKYRTFKRTQINNPETKTNKKNQCGCRMYRPRLKITCSSTFWCEPRPPIGASVPLFTRSIVRLEVWHQDQQVLTAFESLWCKFCGSSNLWIL